MFKIIEDFVPQPTFMILCDRSCGQFMTIGIPAEPPDPTKVGTRDQYQAMWAAELLKQGWRITLAEQICPLHVKQDAEGKSLIVIPDMTGAMRH